MSFCFQVIVFCIDFIYPPQMPFGGSSASSPHKRSKDSGDEEVNNFVCSDYSIVNFLYSQINKHLSSFCRKWKKFILPLVYFPLLVDHESIFSHFSSLLLCVKSKLHSPNMTLVSKYSVTYLINIK